MLNPASPVSLLRNPLFSVCCRDGCQQRPASLGAGRIAPIPLGNWPPANQTAFFSSGDMVFEPVCIPGQNSRPTIVAERQPGRLGPVRFNFPTTKAARFSGNHSVHPFVTRSIFVLFSRQSCFYHPLDNFIVRFLKSRLNDLCAFLLHPVIGGCHRNRCRHFNQPADDALPQPVYQVGGTIVAGNDRRQLCFVPSVDEYEELLAYPVA